MAKPGEEQTFNLHFKFLESEIGKINAVLRPNAAMGRQTAEEAKKAMKDFEAHLTQTYDDKLNIIGFYRVNSTIARTSASRASTPRSWLSSSPPQLPAQRLFGRRQATRSSPPST